MQYHQKTVGDEVGFLYADKHKVIKVFHKLIVSFWVCIARCAQSTQNKKFAISLNYLKTGVSDEVDFLHVDKHDTIIRWGWYR